MTEAFNIERLEREIAEYDAEIDRFRSEGDEDAARTVLAWKQSLLRKIDVIKREGL